MKSIVILLALLISLIPQAKGQLFGSEKVTIYGVTLNAKDITGQRKFNSSSHYYRTDLLSPLEEKRDKEFLFGLGSYRTHKNRLEKLDLFNYSSHEESFPLLDTIDFHFYQSRGFDLAVLRNPQLSTNPLFLELKDLLRNTKLTKDKKNILFQSKYSVIRDELILSRYDIIPKTFTVGKSKVTTSTAELKAELDTILLNNNVEASAKIRAYLYGLADEKLDLTGVYYDARLSDTYIGIINYHIAHTPVINIGDDMFAFYLKQYVNSETAAANTGLVAIQLSGTYDKTKVSKESISVDLQSKFQIPAEKAIKISASVSYSFTKDETVNLKTQFNSVFIIRYFTSEVIDEVKFPSIKTVVFQENSGLRMGRL